MPDLPSPAVTPNLPFGKTVRIGHIPIAVVPGTEPSTVRIVSAGSGWTRELGDWSHDAKDVKDYADNLMRLVATYQAKQRTDGRARKIDKRRGKTQ